jgi:hypothetical protein
MCELHLAQMSPAHGACRVVVVDAESRSTLTADLAGRLGALDQCVELLARDAVREMLTGRVLRQGRHPLGM